MRDFEEPVVNRLDELYEEMQECEWEALAIRDKAIGSVLCKLVSINKELIEYLQEENNARL